MEQEGTQKGGCEREVEVSLNPKEERAKRARERKSSLIFRGLTFSGAVEGAGRKRCSERNRDA